MLCPLKFSLWRVITPGGTGPVADEIGGVNCDKQRCAWWVIEANNTGRCAVLNIANALEMMFSDGLNVKNH